MSKRALVAISFGTSDSQAREAIENIESALRQEFKGYDFYRAFTSQIIIDKIGREEQLEIPNPSDLMKLLYEKGYDEVLCQSLHMIPGIEYEKMMHMVMPYAGKFKSLKIGKPLLSEAEDFQKCAKALIPLLPVQADNEAVVLMGHGSEHFANAAYALMENTLRGLGQERTYIGTVEGSPDYAYVAGRLANKEIQKAYLMPFMVVAGDHAKNDLCGDDAESWSSMLKQNGFQTQHILKGLGEYTAIANMFVSHLQAAADV